MSKPTCIYVYMYVHTHTHTNKTYVREQKARQKYDVGILSFLYLHIRGSFSVVMGM